MALVAWYPLNGSIINNGDGKLDVRSSITPH